MDRVTEATAPKDVIPFVGDLAFPCLKSDAVLAVRRNGAPDEVVDRLRGVRKSNFDSLGELSALYTEGGPDTPASRPRGEAGKPAR
jgi:hypothetical protein